MISPVGLTALTCSNSRQAERLSYMIGEEIMSRPLRLGCKANGRAQKAAMHQLGTWSPNGSKSGERPGKHVQKLMPPTSLDYRPVVLMTLWNSGMATCVSRLRDNNNEWRVGATILPFVAVSAEWKECILCRRMADEEENPLSANRTTSQLNGRLVHASGWCRSSCLRRNIRHMDGGSSLYGLPPESHGKFGSSLQAIKANSAGLLSCSSGYYSSLGFILPHLSTSLGIRMNYFWC